ncbi:MAG: DUF819 family protein [Saprospiraceae bacterium]|nr:DUF819 family protein [Saprospiraceae bacterium]
MSSFIHPDQHLLIWTILLAASALGIVGERIGWFARISGVLVTILFMSLLATTGVVPSASDPDTEVPVYDWVFAYIVPIAIPLLLFNADLKKIVRESGRLLGIFLIGALGVVLGAVIAAFLLDLGEETYKVAGTFIGTYTGGSVNFMAVASALDFLRSPLFASTIAVDNVFTNLYIAFLFYMPFIGWLAAKYSSDSRTFVIPADELPAGEEKGGPGLLEKLAVSLLISSAICALGFGLAPLIADWMNTSVQLDILLITLLIVAAANVFPGFLRKFESTAYELGMLLLYVFLAVIGAASDLREIISSSPAILLFAAITLLVHLLVILLAGRLLRLSLWEVAIASAANAGGPSVAAPMAAAFKQKGAISSAVLIGVLGYVIGTFLGVGVGIALQ